MLPRIILFQAFLIGVFVYAAYVSKVQGQIEYSILASIVAAVGVPWLMGTCWAATRTVGSYTKLVIAGSILAIGGAACVCAFAYASFMAVLIFFPSFWLSFALFGSVEDDLKARKAADSRLIPKFTFPEDK